MNPATTPALQRVLVFGNSGAGKSTFAAALAQRLGVPVVHLDAHYWQAGWQEPDKAAWQLKARELAQGERWVMDGVYSSTLQPRLARCDTIVILDYPRWQSYYGLVQRWWRYRGTTRPDLAPECPEQWSWEMCTFIWTWPKRRQRLLAMLKEHATGKATFTFNRRTEANAFLQQVPPSHAGH